MNTVAIPQGRYDFPYYQLGCGVLTLDTPHIFASFYSGEGVHGSRLRCILKARFHKRFEKFLIYTLLRELSSLAKRVEFFDGRVRKKPGI
jgi:hypothetical protein